MFCINTFDDQDVRAATACREVERRLRGVCSLKKRKRKIEKLKKNYGAFFVGCRDDRALTLRRADDWRQRAFALIEHILAVKEKKRR